MICLVLFRSIDGWVLFLDRKGRLNNALFGVVYGDLNEVAHLGSLQNISSVGLYRVNTDF